MLALEIDKELRKATPVDTGHARRNWVPSVGEPHEGVVTSEAAHAAGVAAVVAYELASGSLWVSNSVPYIRRLNYGHSQQAPAGFVERAIALALRAVETRTKDKGISAMREQYESELGGAAAENLASAYSPFGDT
jgi:hypothetical protein